MPRSSSFPKELAKIKIESLPMRTRTLDAEDLKNIFGGCTENGGTCGKDEDCCVGYCDHHWFVGICLAGSTEEGIL